MSAQPILDVRMRALQLAHALVRGREVELHNIGKLPNDASWWQYSQEIEDQRIAELQLLCEGMTGDSNLFAATDKYDLKRYGNVIFTDGYTWVYRCRKTGKAYWGASTFAVTYTREAWITKLATTRATNALRREQIEAVKNAGQQWRERVRVPKPKSMPISEFKRTLSATVKAALHTGDGPYSVEVDGCVVTFTREQGLNWR